MSSSLRRKRLKIAGILACGVLTAYYLLGLLFSTSVEEIPIGVSEVMIVTVLSPDLSREYVARIKENREDYASRHGKSF